MLQAHHLLQRAYIGHVDLQALVAQQVGAMAVGHAHTAGLHGASQLHGHARVLLKGHFHIRIQRGAQHLDGQVGGQVAQVGCKVQPVQPDLCIGLAGIAQTVCPGRTSQTGLPSSANARWGSTFTSRCEGRGADERHLEGQVAHRVGGAHAVVDEVDAAARERQVVQRQARRALVGLRFALGRGDLGNDVVHVVAGPSPRWVMRNTGLSMVKASTTGARRSSDCSSPSA